jgi:hypothetical protein
MGPFYKTVNRKYDLVFVYMNNKNSEILGKNFAIRMLQDWVRDKFTLVNRVGGVAKN